MKTTVDIDIRDPLKLSLSIDHVDERIPVIEFSYEVATPIERFRGSQFFTSNGSISISYIDFDHFLKALNAKEGSAVLKDLSDQFYFELIAADEGDYLICEFSQGSYSGSKTMMHFESEINKDERAVIEREFIQFPRWWTEGN